MQLSEINEQEHKQNEAFKLWVSSWALTNRQRLELQEYIEGLTSEIADLKSDKYRSDINFLK